MTRFGAAICLFLTVQVMAQTHDIHQRVLRALGPGTGERAVALLKDRRFAEVESMLAQATSTPPAETLALRGALEFLSGRAEAAANFFRQAEAVAELEEPDRFTLAMAYVQLGLDDEARRELTRLAAQEPRKAVYVYWLGRVDYDQRRYTEAAERLQKATELDGKSARAWDSLGLAYDMQGDPEKALQAFEQGVLVNRAQTPHSPWPPHDLGALLLRTGETKKAVLAFREALEYDPQMERAHYHLGRALENGGNYEEALKEYQIASREDIRATDVCYSLAILNRKMGRNKEADASFAEWRRRREAQH